MAARLSKLSTATIAGSNHLVPWLAAKGPLAYSPAEPPARDYFFQYSWILPEIFEPGVNLRRHRYFGDRHKENAGFLLSNLRITTFFAGESELKIIDPSRVSVVETVGCQMEFNPVTL
jgi:hypothetical protein